MEKSSMYNREGILMRKNKKAVDKNMSAQNYEESKNKLRMDTKKQNIGKYHNYLRVQHFGTV